MGNVIKLPGAMNEISTDSIYQDDLFVIGLGKNDKGHHIIVVRCLPDGLSWYWDLENFRQIMEGE